ncbi:RNase H domain-containing protein [Trichonephila clavipes]|nr:RNase H domain-containing protein [Trichonephila clavipes]
MDINESNSKLNNKDKSLVEVLENARSLKFLGCFPNPQESSPCAKNSLLFSCIHKKKHHKSHHHQHRRSSSDENVYAPEIASPSPYDTDRTCETDDTRSKELDICSTDDEEYVLSGFRKRPKTICYDPNRSRDSDGGSIRGRRKLESSASFGSQQSYDESEREFLARNARRPSQLNISARGGNEFLFISWVPHSDKSFQTVLQVADRIDVKTVSRPGTAIRSELSDADVSKDSSKATRSGLADNSRSVDELNDSSATRRREGVDTGRVAKTPDISLDDRRQKHVSFDNGSLVRSNTVAGGLEEVGGDFRGGPVATSTPLSSQRRTFSPPPRRNRSQERLLDGFVTARPPLEFSDRPTSVASSYRYQDVSSDVYISLPEVRSFLCTAIRKIIPRLRNAIKGP